MSTVRMFLEMANAKDCELHQMDVHNAFLHGYLDEEVYMKLPPRFKIEDKNRVSSLKITGLKQAPHCWFAKLKTTLVSYGFSQSYKDYSLFSMRK